MEIDSIKERILEFLRVENKSSANFAQEIGVQPSAISHIISGRNKPSLDFIMKMINRYPSLSVEWLLFGHGKMMQENSLFDLFQADTTVEMANGETPGSTVSREGKPQPSQTSGFTQVSGEKEKSNSLRKSKASRIVIFYDDNSFTEYFPGSE